LDQLLKAMMHHEPLQFLMLHYYLCKIREHENLVKAIHGNTFNVIEYCVYEEHEVHKLLCMIVILWVPYATCQKHSSTLLDHTCSIQFITLVWLRAIELYLIFHLIELWHSITIIRSLCTLRPSWQHIHYCNLSHFFLTKYLNLTYFDRIQPHKCEKHHFISISIYCIL
jgi:hypothetical protein